MLTRFLTLLKPKCCDERICYFCCPNLKYDSSGRQTLLRKRINLQPETF